MNKIICKKILINFRIKCINLQLRKLNQFLLWTPKALCSLRRQLSFISLPLIMELSNHGITIEVTILNLEFRVTKLDYQIHLHLTLRIIEVQRLNLLSRLQSNQLPHSVSRRSLRACRIIFMSRHQRLSLALSHRGTPMPPESRVGWKLGTHSMRQRKSVLGSRMQLYSATKLLWGGVVDDSLFDSSRNQWLFRKLQSRTWMRTLMRTRNKSSIVRNSK